MSFLNIESFKTAFSNSQKPAFAAVWEALENSFSDEQGLEMRAKARALKAQQGKVAAQAAAASTERSQSLLPLFFGTNAVDAHSVVYEYLPLSVANTFIEKGKQVAATASVPAQAAAARWVVSSIRQQVTLDKVRHIASFAAVRGRFWWQQSPAHPYHLAGPSFLMVGFCLAAFLIGGGTICLFTVSSAVVRALVSNFFLLLVLIGTITVWFSELRREMFQGFHTYEVIHALQLAVMMFLSSEALFFLGFFWGFFHLSLTPSTELGCVWPPLGQEVFQWMEVPLVNTFLLLSSGFSLTLAHIYVAQQFCFAMFLQNYLVYIRGARRGAKLARITVNFENPTESVASSESHVVLTRELTPTGAQDAVALDSSSAHNSGNLQTSWRSLFSARSVYRGLPQWFLGDTILRGVVFVTGQAREYVEAPFSIGEHAYAAAFFSVTGLHGMHVMIGLFGLALCWASLRVNTMVRYWEHSVGLVTAIWYWHFVDVVWLFVLIFIYYDVHVYELEQFHNFEDPYFYAPTLSRGMGLPTALVYRTLPQQNWAL